MLIDHFKTYSIDTSRYGR